ncbi:MAG: Gfo/Idh/MocA family oxidoreductase [Cryobacterium sp.]|nr:Gfo/Idh/MocA family oxidoreductase [Cryobacterium sp.]
MTEAVSLPRTVRLGVIGVGLIAQAVHLKNLFTLRDEFEVVHFCDVSAKLATQMAREWSGLSSGASVRVSTVPESLLADEEVDAVLILTPGTHAYIARKAIEAGKHVFAEKPFSFTSEEALELFSLAEDAGRVLQVGYMKMYDPIIERARAELENIGKVRLVRVTVLHPADDPQFSHQRYVRSKDADLSLVADSIKYEADMLTAALGDVGEPWKSLYSDVLMGSTVHETAVLRALFGEQPYSIGHAQIGNFTPGERLSEPPQLQVLGTLGSCQLVLSWNWLPDYPEYFEEIAVFGSAGRLTLRFPGPYLADNRTQLHVENESDGERSERSLFAGFRTGFVMELIAFHRAICQGEEVVSGAKGAAWDAKILQAVIASLAAASGSEAGGEAGES